MQLGANHLGTFGTNRNDNRAAYLQATLSVGRRGLGKYAMAADYVTEL